MEPVNDYVNNSRLRACGDRKMGLILTFFLKRYNDAEIGSHVLNHIPDLNRMLKREDIKD